MSVDDFNTEQYSLWNWFVVIFYERDTREVDLVQTATCWSRGNDVTDFSYDGRERSRDGEVRDTKTKSEVQREKNVSSQSESRFYTANKVIKLIVLILLIPLPPDVFVKKPAETQSVHYWVHFWNTAVKKKHSPDILTVTISASGLKLELSLNVCVISIEQHFLTHTLK